MNKNNSLKFSDFYYRYTKLFKILTLILIVPLLYGLFFTPQSNVVSKKTILVSQKNIPFVNTIELVHGGKKSLLLKKIFTNNSDRWIGIQNNTTDSILENEDSLDKNIIFPVDFSKITQLLKYAAQERTIEIISNDLTDFKTYNLDSNTSFQMVLKGIDTNYNLRTFSHLYFGKTDITGRNIIFRTNEANAVYRTIDDFYSFCSTDSFAWVDGKFLPDNVLEGRTVNQVAYVSFKKGSISKRIEANLDNQKSIVDTLFSMQSNTVVSKNNLQNAQLMYSILIGFIDNTSASFSVYGRNGQSFFVLPEQSQTYSYILEISDWSVQRIEELFSNAK